MAMTDIHDIKSLEIIGLDPAWIRIAAYTLLAMAVIAAAMYIWKKLKKRRVNHVAAPLSPDEAALKQLDGLTDIENIDGKEFYFRLSAIMRNYIDGRFGIHAPEMTTEELLPRIDALEIAKEMQKELKELLRACDPVKFAGFPSVISTMKRDLFFAINFVKETTL
jgi:hypothetical protein